MEAKQTLLIIDDEPDFLFAMRFFFESTHFKVITASNAQEGLGKARLNPDLILIDLKMPGMGGLELCKRLKEDEATRYIPAIVLTSGNETLDKVTAFDLGVVDFMRKDFPLEEILARVSAALRASSLEGMQKGAKARNKKILELRSALKKNDIRILYQSIVDLSTRVPIGYEALARGPQGTFLENPVDLFAFAAGSGMLIELDTLCRDLSVQNAKFLKPREILFLNTDPSVITTDRFRKLEFLDGSAITPGQVCVEITERTFVKNFPALSKYLTDMRSQGVKIAVDDVGEGYSSLNAIAELKPDFMKIDIAIVRNIDVDSIKPNLVRLIADLAKSTNSCLIAEGVETQAEIDALVSLGVKYGQGYFFMRPA